MSGRTRKRTQQTKPPQKLLNAIKGDIGTPELHQREVVTVNRGLARVVTVTTFDYYHSRGWIEDHHYNAAAELLRCAYAGGIVGYGRSCLSERIPGVGSYSEGEASARMRYRKAMDAIKPAAAQSLVYEVIVCNSTLRSAGKAIKVHERNQMAMLKDSLTDVARAFGFPVHR